MTQHQTLWATTTDWRLSCFEAAKGIGATEVTRPRAQPRMVAATRARLFGAWDNGSTEAPA
jgi:hypothetical protein